jgi:glycosyltransferase involved in cell wall biosynthesis
MVLHLSNFHLEGGAGVAATRLHRALLKSGIDSRMLVTSVNEAEEGVAGLDATSWQSKKNWIRFAAERLYFYPQEKDSTVRFAFSPAAVGADISKHPLVQKADILHLHWINFGFLSLQSLDKLFSLGKPVVWTLHDMWTFTGGCHYSRGCQKYLSHCEYCPYLAKPEQYDMSFSQFEQKRKLYGQTRIALVSPSNWLTQLMKSAELTRYLSSQNIPNCLDTTLFAPHCKSEIRQKLNLPTDKNLILFAGANTQDPRKGFDYFTDAVGQINKLSEQVEVLILGKASLDSFNSFPAKVHYLGKITRPEDMANAYNAADMIVVPSLEDNLPNTIMEAMACGTPAVGFATGGIPEMIDHQINGYVSEFASSKSLADGIFWVLDHKQQLSLSEKAREKVLRLYSENIIAQQYQSLYQSLLQK